MSEGSTALLGLMDVPTEEFNNCTLSIFDTNNSGVDNELGYCQGAELNADSKLKSSFSEFFASRNGVLKKSLEEVNQICLKERDGNIHKTWLLTEIDYWDNEKERLVVLTDESILSIKYDFIAEKALMYNRISIKFVDRIIQGDLTYPSKSFIPRINGISEGVSTVVKDVVGNKLSTVLSPSSKQDDQPSDKVVKVVALSTPDVCSSPKSVKTFSLENFTPRNRNKVGVRAMWNNGRALSFFQKWNPFNEDIPWVTFTSHPLYFNKDQLSSQFSVEDFCQSLKKALDNCKPPVIYQFETSQITVENYLNIPAVIHNSNHLGYFKFRGKVSF